MKLKTKKTAQSNYAVIMDRTNTIKVVVVNGQYNFTHGTLNDEEALDYWNFLLTPIEERDISADAFSDENKDVFENEARIVRMEGKLSGDNSIDALTEVLAIEFELGNNEKGFDSYDFYTKNGNEFGIFLDGRNAHEMYDAIKYIYPQKSEEYSVFKQPAEQIEIIEYDFRSLLYKDSGTERDTFFKRLMDDDIMWTEFDAVVEEMKNLEPGYYNTTGELIITLKQYHDLFIGCTASRTRVAARFIIPQFNLTEGLELTFGISNNKVVEYYLNSLDKTL